MSPVIIVPSLQNDWISRLLDNGAQGIIVSRHIVKAERQVPRTNNASMARELVKFGKHRPLVSPPAELSRANGQGERPLAYNPQMQYRIPDFKWSQHFANETTLCIPMIETVEGLENCEEIAAVPGVDAIFVGAHDLSDE